MRKDAPLSVDVPGPERDSPGWVKVGVIAAVGFVIGIAWPSLVGVRLGPSAPGEASSAAAAPSASTPQLTRAPDAPPASVAAKPSAAAGAAASAPAASSAAAAPSAGPPLVSVQKGAILGCKTDDGDAKKGKECGSAASVDALVLPRLKKLAQCSAAEGQSGKLSFVVNADFASGRLGWDIGKSSTVGNLDGMKACLQTDFHGVSIAKSAPHDNPRYTVAYNAVFTASEPKAAEPADKADSADKAGKTDKTDKTPERAADADATPKPAEAAPASGEGTVAWEVALVRDVPKTGTVVARLPRGSKVKIGSVKEGWYAIKYGDDFKSDGWVYRGALGK